MEPKKDYSAIEHRLSKAKTALIFDHPFIASMAMSMPFIISQDIPTAATNGKYVKFNPDFVTTLDDQELIFLIAHECFHPILEHCIRRGERDPKLWNIAGDYVINELLVNDRVGRMPDSGGLQDTNIYTDGGMTTTGIYDYLMTSASGSQPMPMDGAGQGDFWDDVDDHGGTASEQDQAAAEMKVRVAQAAQAAKMMGKISGGLERLIGEVLNPKVDWRDILQRFVVKCRTDQRSWSRPNRRFISQGLYMPSISGEAMGEIVVAVDCSGSIDNTILSQFAAEIKTIHEDCRPSTIHVLYFDSKVSHAESYGPDDTLDIKAHGGGGTAFAPVFRHVVDHNIEPVAIVFLTDLYCNSWGTEPDCPVLWVSFGKDVAPFGEVVVI
jgi:predicted metal-dependent peptidase